MKKTIISLSIVAGLFLCAGLISSNRHIEIKNDTKSNIAMDLLSKGYVVVNATNEDYPGTTPPK